MIKHIFSDMDGTLLQSSGTVSEKTIQIIKESRIPFTLVSARAPREMTEAIDALGLYEPQIAFNSGVIFQPTSNGIKVLQEHHIPTEKIIQAIQMVKREFPEVSIGFYNLDNWFVERIDHGIKVEMKYSHEIPEIVNFVTLLKQNDLKVYKVMFNSYDFQEMNRLISRLHELDLNVNIKKSADECLEITSEYAQKSRGVAYIQELESLDKSEMAAFGDGFNDVSMLEDVGTPIVMDNALEGVKEYGRYITKDNDHDGVAYGIEQFLK